MATPSRASSSRKPLPATPSFRPRAATPLKDAQSFTQAAHLQQCRGAAEADAAERIYNTVLPHFTQKSYLVESQTDLRPIAAHKVAAKVFAIER